MGVHCNLNPASSLLLPCNFAQKSVLLLPQFMQQSMNFDRSSCSLPVASTFELDAVAPRIGQVPSKKITKLQHSYKFVKEVGALEVCQARMFIG